MSDNPFSDPYSSPQMPEKPVFDENAAPPMVWQWYRAYCIGMALLYFICAVAGAVLILNAENIADSSPEMDALGAKIQGVIFLVMGIGLFLLYSVPLFMGRSKASWILGFVTIGIGLTSCCCMPASIPLLIHWLKDETKVFLNAV